VIPEHVLQFVRGSIKSVWTLDLLIMMRRAPGRSWTSEALARELHANETLVQQALTALMQAGLLAADPGGTWRYAPTTPDLEAIAAELERHSTERPLALIREIVSAPNEKIQSFADAFRFKKD
jgi:DNA-binding GntR family transcriptional regulator